MKYNAGQYIQHSAIQPKPSQYTAKYIAINFDRLDFCMQLHSACFCEVHANFSCSAVCNSAIGLQCKVQSNGRRFQCSAVQCNSATVQQYSARVQQSNSSIVQQCNSAIVKWCNSAVQCKQISLSVTRGSLKAMTCYWQIGLQRSSLEIYLVKICK